MHDQHQINWNFDRALLKVWSRVQNMVRYVAINVSNDTTPTQTHQTTGYVNEVRDNIPRIQHFGHSSLPPVGAKGLVLTGVAGDQGEGVIISVDDPRYRPTGLQAGEHANWMVDGPSAKDGTGGTMRLLLKGAQGWIATLFGKTINVGDTNAVTINVGTTASSVAINMGGSSAAVNITGATGDVVVNGVSLVNHIHSGVTPGGGDTGPPVG